MEEVNSQKKVFGLEVTSKIISFQALCHRQGNLILPQLAQSPILSTASDGASKASLTTCITTLIVKIYSSYLIQVSPQFKAIPPCLIIPCPLENPSTALS